MGVRRVVEWWCRAIEVRDGDDRKGVDERVQISHYMYACSNIDI